MIVILLEPVVNIVIHLNVFYMTCVTWYINFMTKYMPAVFVWLYLVLSLCI